MKKIITVAAAMALLAGCGNNDDGSQDFNFDDVSGTTMHNPYPNFHGGDIGGEKNFATLINNYLSAKVEPTPWAGAWWPYSGNGIANGQYSGGSSPAGKYDAARGNTNAQGWEIKNHGAGVKGIQGWWGHCNGWTAAAGLFPEPHDSVTVNGVTFGIADIKALLTEAAMSVNADFYGNRVDYANDYNTPKYTDTVPDQYFLVLTNYIGKLKQPVLIDRYTGDQIWNQPMAGYAFNYPKPEDYLGASPDAPGIYRIMVTSTIWWLRDDVSADVQTPPFDFQTSDTVESRELRMEVWLDGPVVFGPDGKITSSGNVVVTRSGDYFVGGAWRVGDGIFDDGWPDYMWVPFSVIKPYDPEDDYANPEVDIDWLKEHILPPGGRDDPNSTPHSVAPAPSVSPSPSWLDGHDDPYPTPTRTSNAPNPTPTSTNPDPTFPPFGGSHSGSGNGDSGSGSGSSGGGGIFGPIFGGGSGSGSNTGSGSSGSGSGGTGTSDSGSAGTGGGLGGFGSGSSSSSSSGGSGSGH